MMCEGLRALLGKFFIESELKGLSRVQDDFIGTASSVV